MKTLKLLNKKYLSIIFIIFIYSLNINAEDKPIDIWNIEKKDIGKNTSNNILETENLEEEVPNSNIYEMQSQNEINSVEIDSSLNSKKN